MKLFLATSSGILNMSGINKLNDCLNRDIDGDAIVESLDTFVSEHESFSETTPFIYFNENFSIVDNYDDARIIFIHDKITVNLLNDLIIDKNDKLIYHNHTSLELINKFSPENSRKSHQMQVRESLYRQIILKLFTNEEI